VTDVKHLSLWDTILRVKFSLTPCDIILVYIKIYYYRTESSAVAERRRDIQVSFENSTKLILAIREWKLMKLLSRSATVTDKCCKRSCIKKSCIIKKQLRTRFTKHFMQKTPKTDKFQGLEKDQRRTGKIRYLWPPYWIGQAIIFLPCGFFLSCFFLLFLFLA